MKIKRIVIDGDPTGDLVVETGVNDVENIDEENGGMPETDVVWFVVYARGRQKLSQHNWRYVKMVEYG